MENLHNSQPALCKRTMNDDKNQAWLKNPFKVQIRLMDCNITECEKFLDMVSESILQLTFKKIPFVKFYAITKIFTII